MFRVRQRQHGHVTTFVCGEVEEVMEVVGESVTITGLYSYGEIAPFIGENNCQLHNQTMTITLISE